MLVGSRKPIRPRCCRRNRVRELQNELLQRAKDLQVVEEEHARLARRQAVLLALVDFLQWMRLHLARTRPEGTPATVAAVLDAEAVEQLLLQQLPGRPGLTCSSGRRLDLTPTLPPADAVAPDDPAHQAPCCPDDDPFLLYRCAMALPADPQDRALQVSGYCELRASRAARQALAVQQVESGLAAEAAAARAAAARARAAEVAARAAAAEAAAVHGSGSAEAAAAAAVAGRAAVAAHEADAAARAFAGIDKPLQCIRELRLTGLRAIITLARAGREGMLSAMSLTNTATGETLSEPSLMRHRVVVESMRLTEAQLHRLLDGAHVLRRVMAPIHKEIRQLNERSLLSAERAARALRQPGASDAFHCSQASQGAHLQEMEELVARLAVLQRKDRTLRGAALGFMFGCLSFLQMGKLAAGIQPFGVHVPTFLVAVAEQAESRLARPQGAPGNV